MMIKKIFIFKEKLIMFMTCFLSVLLISWAFTLSFSMDQSFNMHLKEIYGKWQNAIISTNEETINRIEDRAFLNTIGKQKVQGEVLINGEKIGNIGSIDENFIDIANIKVKEGRLPTSSNEIAVEEVILEALGVDEHINQKIILDIYSNQELKKVEYDLVGIIEVYSLNWVRSDVLVNCISCDTEECVYVNGYMLWENGAEQSIESIPISSGSYIKNTYYEMGFRNSYNHFSLSIPVICIVFFISSSLISNHVKTRCKEYFVFLSCGAKFKEIQRSLLEISLRITLLSVGLAILIHVPLSFLSVNYLCLYFDYPLYCSIPFLQHLLFILTLFSVVTIAVLQSCNQIKKIKITDLSSHNLMTKNEKVILKFSKPSFFIRNILIHRKLFGLMLISIVISLIICFSSIHKMFYSQKEYQTVINSSKYDYRVKLTDYNLYGYTAESISRITKIAGIASVQSYRNEIHNITFNDIKDSEYYNTFSKNGELSVNVLGLDETDYQSLLEVEPLLSEGVMNADRILNGTEAILVLPIFSCDNLLCKVMIDRSLPLYENDVFESTLSPGELIKLISKDGKEVTLEVSGIIRNVPLSLYEKYGDFMIITGDSIFDNENANLLYLTVSDEASVVTDLLISQRIGASPNIEIANQRIVKQQLSDSYINLYINTIIVSSLSLLIELMIFWVSLEKVYSFFGYQRNTLLLLGIGVKEERKLYIYYFQWIVLLVGTIICFLFLQYEYLSYSTILQRNGETIFESIAYREIFSLLAIWVVIHWIVLKFQYNSMKKAGEKLNENFIRGR